MEKEEQLHTLRRELLVSYLMQEFGLGEYQAVQCLIAADWNYKLACSNLLSSSGPVSYPPIEQHLRVCSDTEHRHQQFMNTAMVTQASATTNPRHIPPTNSPSSPSSSTNSSSSLMASPQNLPGGRGSAAQFQTRQMQEQQQNKQQQQSSHQQHHINIVTSQLDSMDINNQSNQ